MRKFFKSVFLFLNLIAVLALLLSYLSTYISPEKYKWLALFGIGYGIILVTNVGFILFWLMVKKRFALISIVTIALGYTYLDSYIQFFPKKEKPTPEEPFFKLVTHNVKLFGLYNWNTNEEDKRTMLNNLKTIEADVYCFQEYFLHSKPGKFDTRSLIEKEFNLPYYHEYFTNVSAYHQHYGIATFSKYPIVNSGYVLLQYDSGNACIFSDIKIGNDTLRIYNAHVASIRFGDDEHQFMDELINKPENVKVKPIFKKSRVILNQLEKAYVKRAIQVRAIKKHAEESPHPVIICGDFNETPVSYSYAQISNGLVDAFRKNGWGISNTYIGEFPSFRIDYIFHSPELKSQNYRKYPEEISDHHALSTEIYWEE